MTFSTLLLCLALPLSGLLVHQNALAEASSLAPAVQPATPITTKQDGVMLTVQGELNTQVGREVAWSVLTDYTRFPEFVPGVLSNRVLASANGLKRIAQRGQVNAGQFGFQYEGIMQVAETHGEGIDIVFLSGPFKDVRGAWRLSAAQPVKLSYSMRMDLTKAPFPPPLTPGIAQQQVSAWVGAFAQEMARRARMQSTVTEKTQASQTSISPDGRRK